MGNQTNKTAVGLSLVIAFVAIGACSPLAPVDVKFRLRFASMEQAQNDEPSIPPEASRLLVQVRAAGQEGALLAESGCLSLEDLSDRKSISLDIDEGRDLVVTAAAWDQPTGCDGDPTWFGLTKGVLVLKGEETTIGVYVTRRGMTLNDTRGDLPTGRAFATATTLPDGTVFVAGGFDGLSSSSSPTELQAACDAQIYDPGSAKFVRSIPLAAGCRGMHHAHQLANGSVLLVGGCGRATFDVSGSTRPVLRPDPESMLSTAELYDPNTGVSRQLGTASALRRADAATVLLPDDSIIMLGGRTNQLRTADAVTGSASAGTWTWDLTPSVLNAERSAAQAAMLAPGILVAGGNLSGTADLELVDPFSLQAQQVTPSGSDLPPLANTGHSLTATGDNTVLLAGGMATAPGSGAVDHLLDGTWSSGTLDLVARSLTGPRAYHAAVRIDHPGTGGTPLIVLIGGLDANRTGRTDLESIEPGRDGQALPGMLDTGSVGVATARLADDSILIVGGLGVTATGAVSLSNDGQLLSP